MSIPQLLHSMCAELGDTDLNAIRKARGFGSSETASRSSFASFFVSSIGLQKGIESLTAEESATLYLLHQTGEVSISFFERLYGSDAPPGQATYAGTYTQQFKPTFDAVKKNLARKGLLIMAENKTRAESVQMERWRYALPPEFVPYLPALLQFKTSDQAGETSDAAVRKKLRRLVGGGPVNFNDYPPISIQDGKIWLGQNPFSVGGMFEWQMRAWQIILSAFKPTKEASLAATDATLSLLKSLGAGQWAAVDSLGPVLKIFCFGVEVPSAEKILQEGWEYGILSRLQVDSHFYYRAAPSESAFESDFSGLDFTARAGAVQIDLGRIPLTQLELLNNLVGLGVEDGVLQTELSLIKLGRATPVQRQSPLAQHLAEGLPAFKEILTTVNERWGKILLHENLLVARVRDLSLRVQLERELGSDLVVLSEHFIAFPVDARASVEKAIKKSGFVIKTI